MERGIVPEKLFVDPLKCCKVVTSPRVLGMLPETEEAVITKVDNCDSHATVIGRVPRALLYGMVMLVRVAELQFTPNHAPLHGSLPPQPELLIQDAPPVLLYS